MKKKSLRIGCIALCAVLATGCSGRNYDDTQNADMVEPTPAAGAEPTAGTESTAGAEPIAEAKSKKGAGSEKDIGMKKAKAIALSDAGLKEKDGTWKKAKKDRENGRIVYELEFISKGIEYEFEINAKNGKILDFDKESVNN